MFFTERGAVSMPLWEKILILIVITISITSIYAAIHAFLDSQRGAGNGNNTTSGPKSPLDKVPFVSRVEWGAQPPLLPPSPLAIHPAPYVIISHTASGFCYTRARCVLTVRVAQSLHVDSKGWNDIGYSFLVGGDGGVYEGRGWNVLGAHTFKYNNRSIGISFVGTFTNVLPTDVQLEAAQKLIEYGVKSGNLSKDYKLLGHRQCSSTESPGEVLYNIIKTWEHWTLTP